MPFDTVNMEEITKARRKAIAESIRTISVEELKALGERLFPLVDNPWREKFFGFITENSGATFHHATTHDHVQIIYCHAKDKGMWFMPGIWHGPDAAKGAGDFESDRRRALARALHHAIRLTAPKQRGQTLLSGDRVVSKPGPHVPQGRPRRQSASLHRQI